MLAEHVSSAGKLKTQVLARDPSASAGPWSCLLAAPRSTASAVVISGDMFHFESLQVQKVCVGLGFVVSWHESRTPLHPLHVPSPSLVEEQ